MICETLSRVAVELDEIAMTHRPFSVPVTESRCSTNVSSKWKHTLAVPSPSAAADTHVCTNVCMYVRTYVCMNACMDVRMHACMYVCIHVSAYGRTYF
jgi:hypothetical protein